MNNIELQIQKLIKNKISVSKIDIIDDSYKHRNHQNVENRDNHKDLNPRQVH